MKQKPHFESCFVEIKLRNSKLAIGSVYRPPNTDAKLFCKKFTETINKLKSSKHQIIIGTDHNLDFLKADKHKPTQGFIESILENACVPPITRPTRITNQSATLIDNIIIDRQIYNNQRSGIAISDLSDHFPCILSWKNVFQSKKGYVETQSSKASHPYNKN